MYAQILEDNAGGIHYTTGGHSCSFPGFWDGHPEAGRMISHLLSMSEWLDDLRAMHPDDADLVGVDEPNMALVAVLSNGVITLYPEKMGVSARIYTGITDLYDAF